jgi:hypothetical protein
MPQAAQLDLRGCRSVLRGQGEDLQMACIHMAGPSSVEIEGLVEIATLMVCRHALAVPASPRPCRSHHERAHAAHAAHTAHAVKSTGQLVPLRKSAAAKKATHKAANAARKDNWTPRKKAAKSASNAKRPSRAGNRAAGKGGH